MSSDPVIRLHLFFASESPIAVILRQGPSKTFRMILWDRDTDRFEDGQWLKHKVYAERCDVSPDGRHFLYFALNGDWGGPSRGAYTALSRPPFFTALALFPEGDTWGGGGRFLDDALYVADGDHDIIGRDDGLVRLFRGTPDDDCPSGLRRVDGRCARIGKAKAARAFERPRPPDPELDRYDSMGGRLYRRHGQKLELIRDFSDMAFEPIRAPYDWRAAEVGEEPAPWHPLDGEGA